MSLPEIQCVKILQEGHDDDETVRNYRRFQPLHGSGVFLCAN